MIQAADFQRALQLTLLSPSTKKEWDIRSADLNRPGMQFCGFYEYFAFERPQVIGKVEMTYLEEQPSEKRREMLEEYFSFDIPCVIICRGMRAPEELLEVASEHDVAVYQTEMLTTKFTFNAITYLNRCLAPRVTRHGVLVSVDGIGVLLTGESGVGKSEAALELVRRGHQLVADDVIDIRTMYGVSAVAQSRSIDLVMNMEQWVAGKAYDRLGLHEEYTTILGVKVPSQTLPVRPGRNIAIIIEVAARNLSLKRMGFSAAKELDKRMQDMIRKRSGQSEDE